MANSDVLTVKELATENKLALSTVYGLIKAGQLPHIRFGTSVRIRRSSYEQWVAAQEARSGLVL
jgi:excisionase family DNA binding protein